MILITGARGNVGRELVRALTARGTPHRTADRPLFEFSDATTFDAALDGCSGLFLLRPPAIANVKSTLNVLVDRARALGIRSIVFLSVAGAESNKLVPHHAVERHLMSGPSDWTILRPGFFAQNFGDAYLRDIREDDRVYVPAGNGAVTFVDVRDLADVATAAFADPSSHQGRSYTLTGPQPVTFTEAAARLSEVVGREISYKAASIPSYARHLHRRGLPLMQIAVQTVLHVGLRYGQAARVDPTLAELLPKPPRTLGQYFLDHAALFSRTERSAV